MGLPRLISLAPTGSTGNNVHTSVAVGTSSNRLALQFVAEAVGGTPTVTYKFQGSLDNVTFYDVSYITDATATESAATKVATSAVSTVLFLSLSHIRMYNYYRCVTTVNTNVTYRAEMWVEADVLR